MARRTQTIVELLDDIDGSKAEETVTFAIDGTTYEIDLSKKNAKALRADVEKWTASARKARGKARTSGRKTAGKTSDAAAARAWAIENSIEVPSRGRIPAAVMEQYQAALS